MSYGKPAGLRFGLFIIDQSPISMSTFLLGLIFAELFQKSSSLVGLFDLVDVNF
jgi:hypothetical protein